MTVVVTFYCSRSKKFVTQEVCDEKTTVVTPNREAWNAANRILDSDYYTQRQWNSDLYKSEFYELVEWDIDCDGPYFVPTERFNDWAEELFPEQFQYERDLEEKVR